MRLKHRDVVLSQFNMKNGAEFTLDKQSLQVKKTPFPDKFRRHFFKKLREIGLKPKLHVDRKGMRTTKRRKPMMFMNAGSQRCALHDLGCPVKPCEFASLNMKIALTAGRAKKAVKDIPVMKTLAFGKMELHAQLAKIFMTTDEVKNCQFIPKISKPGEGKPEKTYDEKFGVNFTKSDPAIYKKGILKKAWREFREGWYTKAHNTLQTAFNISSLKNHFDPNWYKAQMAQAVMKKFAKKPEAKEE